MTIEKKAFHIPGMIEPIEQHNLFNLSQNIELKNNDCFVEFGTFFGKSTFCISEGLSANKGKKNSIKFYAYDSFTCHKEGRFQNFVIEEAKKSNLQALIKEEKEYIDFSNIFKFFLEDHLSSGVIELMQFSLKKSFPKSKSNIKLMHIDSPKFYNELEFIYERFFPLLNKQSIVIFQDYFFQWSATLIASVQFLIEENILSILNTAASSITTIVTKKVELKKIKELKENMKDIEFILEMIDKAILDTNKYNIDRPNYFVPRLLLARFQFLWDKKLYEKATNFLFNYVNKNHNKLSQSNLNDFRELMRNGFSIRNLYEKDYL